MPARKWSPISVLTGLDVAYSNFDDTSDAVTATPNRHREVSRNFLGVCSI